MKIFAYAMGGILVVILIYSFVFSGYDIRNTPVSGKNVIAIGDSLTVGVGDIGENGGWVPLVEKSSGLQIVRIAKNGATSADGLTQLDELKQVRPDVVIVFLGGNDALRRLARKETFDNLRRIITEVQSVGSAVVLVGVRGGIIGDRYEDEFEKIAEETGSFLVPDVLEDIAFSSRYLSDDRIHPNHEGYELIASRIADALSAVYAIK